MHLNSRHVHGRIVTTRRDLCTLILGLRLFKDRFHILAGDLAPFRLYGFGGRFHSLAFVGSVGSKGPVRNVTQGTFSDTSVGQNVAQTFGSVLHDHFVAGIL